MTIAGPKQPEYHLKCVAPRTLCLTCWGRGMGPISVLLTLGARLNTLTGFKRHCGRTPHQEVASQSKSLTCHQLLLGKRNGNGGAPQAGPLCLQVMRALPAAGLAGLLAGRAGLRGRARRAAGVVPRVDAGGSHAGRRPPVSNVGCWLPKSAGVYRCLRVHANVKRPYEGMSYSWMRDNEPCATDIFWEPSKVQGSRNEITQTPSGSAHSVIALAPLPASLRMIVIGNTT